MLHYIIFLEKQHLGIGTFRGSILDQSKDLSLFLDAAAAAQQDSSRLKNKDTSFYWSRTDPEY